jgi:hypothetical protein
VSYGYRNSAGAIDLQEYSMLLPHYLSGEPWGTVPELLFEKKQLMPALQELLVSYSRPVS